MREVDYLIVGHGLAGATLSWQLRWLDQKIFVVDRPNPNSASRVAAGLISPITGRRNTVSYRFEEFWDAARPFFERVESELHAKLLATDEKTCRVAEGVEFSDEAKRYLGDAFSLPDPFHTSSRELRDASRLNVGRYLDLSRMSLEHLDSFAEFDLAWEKIEESPDRFVVQELDVSAKTIIYCQGIEARNNERFADLPFEPAKGEVIEADRPGGLRATVLGDAWVIPEGDRSLIGTTYDRDFEDAKPTEQGREKILERLKRIADWNPTILSHRAALRPIMQGRMPQVGVVQRQPRIGFFNGLGAKGALRAPLVAEQFSKHLVESQQLDPEFWFERNAKESSGRPIRLTDMAKQYVSSVLKKGEIAIDATAGNGLDSMFLAEQVGSEGMVFVIDLQWEAIRRAQLKLADSGFTNYRLLHGSHADITRLVGEEYRGRVSAVMFNLGYLPRGEKGFVTKTSTTIKAIRESLTLLRSGGVLSVVAYTGHEGGLEEATAVENLLASSEVHTHYDVLLPPVKMSVGPPRHCVAIKRI